MLTAYQIDALRNKSEKLLDPITEFLIEDIAKRIAQAGQLTGTASYEVWRLQNLGISQRELKKRLKKMLKVSEKEVERLLTQAAETGYNFDISRFPISHAIPFAANSSLQQILDATVKQAMEDLTNITQTIGFVGPDGKCRELTQAYQQVCDFAFQKVSTGAQDYISAIRDATKQLAKKGIRTIDYESGVHTSMEAAVRRNIMGGLGLMQEQISQKNHDALGCDGWEIDAHAASAPDHEPIQGKQYTDEEYTKLNNSLVRRIGTLNCGHAAFPIILGVNSPQYTDAELEKFRQDNETGVDFDGKHYTMYEATQRQRQFERAIRNKKREILVDETLGDKDKLQADQIRLVRLRDEYKRFSKGVGLPMQHARMETAGFDWKKGKAAEKTAESNRRNLGESIKRIFKKNSGFKKDDCTFDLDAAKKEYSNFLTSVPEKNRILLEQSHNSVEYEQKKLDTAPFGYSHKQDKVLYDPTRSDFWEMDFVTANTHELAHRIDGFFAESTKNTAFSNAIVAAGKVIDANPKEFIDYCLENDDQGFLSDIFSAISGGRYRFPAGHPAEHWETPGNKESEIFANLFSLESFRDAQKLEYLRKNFAELFDAFEKLEY